MATDSECSEVALKHAKEAYTEVFRRVLARDRSRSCVLIAYAFLTTTLTSKSQLWQTDIARSFCVVSPRSALLILHSPNIRTEARRKDTRTPLSSTRPRRMLLR